MRVCVVLFVVSRLVFSESIFVFFCLTKTDTMCDCVCVCVYAFLPYVFSRARATCVLYMFQFPDGTHLNIHLVAADAGAAVLLKCLKGSCRRCRTPGVHWKVCVRTFFYNQ